MTVDVEYGERSAQRRIQQVSMAQVSVELGHLYAEDFALGYDYLVKHFRSVKPWLQAARARYAVGDRPPRLSTCFLIDDYFTPFSDPARVFHDLRKAAQEADVPLDYIARESGCVVADGVPLAQNVLRDLVDEPTPNTTGVRPKTVDTGWLANGERSTGVESDQAMSYKPWSPPRENARNRHSVFVDVELWDDRGEERRWSCTYLAAVWQLARLGLLRDAGEVAVQTYAIDEMPDEWHDLPAVVQVNPKAQPFSAYRTFSVLSTRYLPVEHATRVILSQVPIDDAIFLPIRERAAREGITLAKETLGRIEYAFID